MAYTKIHAIKATVDKAIDYICNPEKTDEKMFVSSYACSPETAAYPDTYFRRYESQIILYGGARRMLEQADISLKGLNVDKLKAEYQKLMKQKSELTSTYKNCEKEVRELKRKQENLNQYLGRTQPDPAQEQQEKSKNQTL